MNINTGLVPALTIAGRIIPTSGLIVLYGRCNTAKNTTLRVQKGAAGYTPSGAKAFRCAGIINLSLLTAAETSMAPYQSDNDVGESSATALTNPVALAGGGAFSFPTAAALRTEYATDFVVANGKFFSITNGSSATGYFIAYGYEE